MPDLRQVFATGRTRELGWRLAQLEAIERLCDEREADIAEALRADLGRPAVEAWLGDIASTKGEAAYARKHLKKWMRRRRQPLPLAQLPGRGWVQYDPLGVVLIIGPWNYPLYLSLGPLVAAVAAGNCAVIKPSELAPATSALLARLVPHYLDAEAVRVVEGDGQTTQDLLAQGFDHALFTGGTEIGKKIMAAAAPTLTPVTLELGGKSPVDRRRRRRSRRRRPTHRLGQADEFRPDLHRARLRAGRSFDIAKQLTDRIVANIKAFRADEHGHGMRIVNARQFDRLVSLIESTTGIGRDRWGLRARRR